MEIEIQIGREPSGAHVLQVPSSCKKVSRRHATLYWHDGEISIEDHESSNGTFVNGRRVAKTTLQQTDVVTLGGNAEATDCYRIDLPKVIAQILEAENAARTDYSAEFAKVRQAYIDYQREVSALKKGATMKSQMPVRIISIIPTLAGAIIAVLPNANPNARIIAISVGGAITGLVNLLMTGRNSSSADQMNEQITELQIKYQPSYRCPKCGMKYPFTTHWKKFEADGKCPNPKCNATFVKK